MCWSEIERERKRDRENKREILIDRYDRYIYIEREREKEREWKEREEKNSKILAKGRPRETTDKFSWGLKYELL